MTARAYAADERLVRAAISHVVDRYRAIAPGFAPRLATFLQISEPELAGRFEEPARCSLAERVALAAFAEVLGEVLPDADVLEAGQLLRIRTLRTRAALLASRLRRYARLSADAQLERALADLRTLDARTPPPPALRVDPEDLRDVESQLLRHHASTVQAIRRRFFPPAPAK